MRGYHVKEVFLLYKDGQESACIYPATVASLFDEYR